MQHNENSKPNRFQHFLREKGYYIVLALCICAVGVSGWLFLSGAIAEKNALSEPAMSVATETEIPSQPAKTPTQPSASKPAAVTKPAESAPSRRPTSRSTRRRRTSACGGVRRDARARTAWSSWPSTPRRATGARMTGVDLTAAEGAPVRAAANGTVTAVYDDELLGTTVVIGHDDGCVTYYQNLAATPVVSAGDKVEAGQTIGSVGRTALLEVGRTPTCISPSAKTAHPLTPKPLWIDTKQPPLI